MIDKGSPGYVLVQKDSKRLLAPGVFCLPPCQLFFPRNSCRRATTLWVIKPTRGVHGCWWIDLGCHTVLYWTHAFINKLFVFMSKIGHIFWTMVEWVKYSPLSKPPHVFLFSKQRRRPELELGLSARQSFLDCWLVEGWTSWRCPQQLLDSPKLQTSSKKKRSWNDC